MPQTGFIAPERDKRTHSDVSLADAAAESRSGFVAPSGDVQRGRQAQAPAVPAEGPGWVDKAISIATDPATQRNLHRGVGAVAGGAGELLGLVGNPVNYGINALTGANLSTDLGQTFRDATGAPAPVNAGERLGEALIKGASAGGVGLGLAKLATKAPGMIGEVGKWIAADPTAEILGGAGADFSSQGAQELGLPWWAQLGAGLVGGVGAGMGGLKIDSAMRRQAAAPQVDPNGQLLYGSLDGGLDATPAGGAGIMDVLAQRGVTPEQAAAMSPEFQARIMERLQNPTGAPVDAMRGQSASGPVPDDVSMIGAPEGAVRSDDAGSIAGILRKRVSDQNVMADAAARAEDNPTLKAILDANVNTQKKVSSVWDRLAEVDAAGARAPFPEADLRGVDIPDRPAGLPDTKRAAVKGRAIDNADEVLAELVPEARMTQNRRDPNSALGKKNPNSYHVKTGGAIDVAPIKGMTFDQYVNRFRQAGYQIIEAIDEVGAGRTKNATGDHWHVVLGERTGDAPAAPFRTADDGSPEMTRRRNEDDGLEAIGQRPGDFEDMSAQASPTNTQRTRGDINEDSRGNFGPDAGKPYEAPMGTGSSARPFKPVGDDPAGKAGFWESRANMQHEELRRAWEEQMKAGERMRSERTASADPSGKYAKYAQKPAKDGENWKFTDDDFVAGEDGNPVAFRNAKAAAKWAAANKMGGDTEPVVWKTNSTRIVLKRREGSTYGRTEAPTGPSEPAAGRSEDIGQRQIDNRSEDGKTSQNAAQEAKAEPPAPDTGVRAPYRAPEATSGDYAGGPLREEVVTAQGQKIDTEFEVMESADIITSSDKGYDQRFQPRDRGSRSAYDAQVADKAANLDPAQLGKSRLASTGAPIVGPDRMVESGNGRTSFVRRAYEMHPDKAEAYRKSIDDMGFDTTGMKEPVLVRKRLTALDDDARAKLTRDAQDSGVSEMSSPEMARSDAKALSDDTMNKWRGGDVNNAKNADFRKAFIKDVGSSSGLNKMVQDDGTLSVDGLNRMNAAMLSKAYSKPDLINKIIADPDTEIKAIGNVLTDMAPSFAQMQAKIKAGDMPKAFDITPQVAEIAGLIARTRKEGRLITEFLDQNDFLNGAADPITEALAHIMLKGEGLQTARSAKDIRDGLNFFLRESENVKKNLFGDDMNARALENTQGAAQMLRARDASKGEQLGNLFDKKQNVEGRGSGRERGDGKTKNLASELRALEGDEKELGALLADLVGDDARVTYGKKGLREQGESYNTLMGGTTGLADANIGRTWVLREGDAETLLHEALHLAAIRRYGNDFLNVKPGDFAAAPIRDFLKLFNEARGKVKGEALNDRLRYALSSPDEFFSISLTDKKIQTWLEKGGLWRRFADGVRKLLGLEAKWKPMLDDVLTAGRGILEGARKDKPAPYDPEFLYQPRGNKERRQNMKDNPFSRLARNIFETDELAGDFSKAKAAIGNPMDFLGKALKARPGESVRSWVFDSQDAKARSIANHYDSEAIHDLANHFERRGGIHDGKAVGETFDEGVKINGLGRASRAFEMLEPFMVKGKPDTEALDRISTMLRHPKRSVPATAAERDAAGNLRELLKETIDYRKAAGEEIGEVTDGYLMRWMDVDKVIEGKDKFLVRAAKLYEKNGMSKAEAKDAAEAWMTKIFQQDAGLDAGIGQFRVSGTGGGQTAKARTFGEDADRLLGDFYDTNLASSLPNYFIGAATKAEKARRFGPKGAVNSKERAAWVKQHGEKTQKDVLWDRIRNDIEAKGGDATAAVEVLDSAYRTGVGEIEPIGNLGRKIVSNLHTLNILGTLDHATLSSLGELMTGFINAGPKHGAGQLARGVKYFGRELRKADPDDATRWARALGVAQHATVNQPLIARSGIEAATKRNTKLLSKFFQATGLHQLTDGQRTASLATGKDFIRTLTEDLDSKTPKVVNRARKMLADLGIADADGMKARLQKGEISLDEVTGGKDKAAKEYGTALVRYVSDSVMAPTRNQRPGWSSHPVGSLFFSLMSFTYGFKKRILDRVWRQSKAAYKDKDAALLLPAMGLAALTTVQGVADTYLRPNVFGSTYDFENEDTGTMIARVADRAGLTGAASPVINAVSGVRYGRGLTESVAGPAVGRPLEAATKVLGLAINNSEKTNTSERAAAKAIYNSFIEPTLDGLVLARVKNPLVQSAGVLATGNAEGGIAPDDQKRFIDAIAGEKKK